MKQLKNEIDLLKEQVAKLKGEIEAKEEEYFLKDKYATRDDSLGEFERVLRNADVGSDKILFSIYENGKHRTFKASMAMQMASFGGVGVSLDEV